MAYSSITIDFTSVPAVDTVININESVQGLNLLETFKLVRDAAGRVTLPVSSMSRYEMNTSDNFGVSNLGIIYTNVLGGIIRTALANIEVNDLGDGTSTYVIDSSTPVRFYNLQNNEEMVWDYSFASVGGADGYFDGYVSDNYKTAFDLDYNSSSLFTVVSTNGFTNSGIGTVTITANFDNAIFSVSTNTSLATITVNNQIQVVQIGAIAPLNIAFAVNGNIENTEQRQITITTLESWSVTSPLPAWLQLSQSSGVGNAVIIASLNEYASLSSGMYLFAIQVAVNTQVQLLTVLVRLDVNKLLINPFAPAKIYFTKELKFLKFDSANVNTYIQFSIAITIFKINSDAPVTYTRNNYKLPLFQGKGEFHIGTIVHGLLYDIEKLEDFVPSLETNYFKNQYRPAEINISYQEKSFGVPLPDTPPAVIPMFKMAKGYKPFMTDGQLALLTVGQQEIIRITPQSFISTSFVYFGTPRIIVKKNNQIIEDFEIQPVPNKIIYSYFRFLNDVKPGDSIDIIIVKGLETRTQRFICFKNPVESTYFFFENDNGVLESFEFAGRRRLNSAFKHFTTSKFKDLYRFEAKVKTDIDQSLIVNTGHLGKSEHRIVSALIGSCKVWCSLDDPKGPYFKVNSTTTKIMNQDTSSSDEGFDIEFNLLENADASIYPR